MLFYGDVAAEEATAKKCSWFMKVNTGKNLIVTFQERGLIMKLHRLISQPARPICLGANAAVKPFSN